MDIGADRGAGKKDDEAAGGKPRSMVHALVALGLSEIDAWRGVHAMQGRNSVVLVQMDGDGESAVTEAVPSVDAEQIAAADEQGASWSRARTGQWQYLRRVDWCIAKVCELHEELSRLTAAMKQRRG